MRFHDFKNETYANTAIIDEHHRRKDKKKDTPKYAVSKFPQSSWGQVPFMPLFCAPALFGLTIQVVGISEAIRRREQTHTQRKSIAPALQIITVMTRVFSDIHMSPHSQE